MSQWPLYVAYRVFDAIFGALPEPVARKTGEALGWLAWYAAPRRRLIARRVMRRVLGPEASADRVERAARRMFVQYGRYWAEVFWLTPRRKPFFVEHAEIEGIEHALAARDSGRGVIFALPHLGNWEAAGAKAEAIGMRVLAAAESLPNRKITEWFVKTRAAFGIDVVLVEKGARVTAALMKRLREGGVVALVADRDLKGTGIDVEFFGERTTLPPGPAALAERTGAVLLPVGCFFKPGRGYRFLVLPELPVSPGATREERVAATTQAFAHAMESIIRRDPEQWHLLQPNWPSDRALLEGERNDPKPEERVS